MCTENLIFSLFREQEMRSNATAGGKASIKQWGWETKIRLTSSGEEVRLIAVSGWPAGEEVMGRFGVIWVGVMSEKGNQWDSWGGRREFCFTLTCISYITFCAFWSAFQSIFPDNIFSPVTLCLEAMCEILIVMKCLLLIWKTVIIKFIDFHYSLLLNVLKLSH